MNPARISVFDIPIDALPVKEIVERARILIEKRIPSQIVTVNAEFLVAAENDDSFRAILKSSALNTADGFGVLWAAKFLSLPLTWRGLEPLQALFQIFTSGWLSLASFRYVRSVIPEKASGVELAWKLCELAQRQSYSVFFLGGFGKTSALVEKAVKAKLPALRAAGSHSGSPDEPQLLEKLRSAKPDILLVAFGPVRQEKWIAENLKKLEIPLVMGVGGTFDYIAGKKPLAPRFLREIGLEWAFRLITQPYRLKRVFTAVPFFITYVFRCKLIRRRPYRQSLALCLKNSRGEVLICRRAKNRTNDGMEHWQLPHGGREAGESEETALRREMREELGLEAFEIAAWARGIYRYDWPLPFTRFYGYKYRGQILSAAFATAKPEALDKITPDRKEFDEITWVRPEKLLARVHPVQRAFTQAVLESASTFL